MGRVDYKRMVGGGVCVDLTADCSGECDVSFYLRICIRNTKTWRYLGKY